MKLLQFYGFYHYKIVSFTFLYVKMKNAFLDTKRWTEHWRQTRAAAAHDTATFDFLFALTADASVDDYAPFAILVWLRVPFAPQLGEPSTDVLV